MLQWLDQAHSFIQNALQADQNAKVLVYCNTGVNCSAAVVVSYIMKHVVDKQSMAGHELLFEAWRKVAQTWWPVLQSKSFRLKLAMWADASFDADLARQHFCWKPYLFQCFAMNLAQGRLPELGFETRWLKHLMDQEALTSAPFQLSDVEDVIAKKKKIEQFVGQIMHSRNTRTGSLM